MACGERLLKKLDQAERAFQKLKEIKALEDKLEREILYEVASKRFEYTYEALWKTVKLFLLEQKGLECNSPVDCFKGLHAVGLIEDSYAESVVRIVRLRNQVVHIYDFSTAQNVFHSIKNEVIPVFEQMLKNLRESCGE